MHGLTILGLLLVFSIIIQLLGWEPGPLNNYMKPIEYETYERKLSNPAFCDRLIDPQADYQSDKIKWMCEPLYVTEKRRIR